MHCPDAITYDWASATLKDNTANTTTQPLANTCTNSGTWVQVTSAVTAGHSYTLTLSNHDDNYSGDATFTYYDDVALNSTATSDFGISANPTSISATQGGTASSTISTTAIGTPPSVSLSASGLPSGSSASFSPNPVTAGAGSTTTITTSSSTPAGTYTITATGTGASKTHATTVTLTVNPSGGGGGITNGGFETGSLAGWTSTGSAAVNATARRTGSFGAQVGRTSPGSNSSIAQTFTAPTGNTQLSFWYQVHCPDTITYDWASATLKDNTANTTTQTSGQHVHELGHLGAGDVGADRGPQLHADAEQPRRQLPRRPDVHVLRRRRPDDDATAIADAGQQRSIFRRPSGRRAPRPLEA